MITFSVSINGKRITLAGTRDMSVLTAIVTAVGKLGPDSAGSKRQPEGAALDVRVSGMTAPTDGSIAEHITWASLDLQLGDEIVVKVEDLDAAEPPSERRPRDSPVEEERALLLITLGGCTSSFVTSSTRRGTPNRSRVPMGAG